MAEQLLQIEANGINVIPDAERKGRPRDLFWPWFAANISVLGLSFGCESELYDRAGRYGDIRWLPVGLVVLASAIGWGLVTNSSADWLSWQGYLLGPIGLGGKIGAWAFANLGVLAALDLGFLPTILIGRPSIRLQETAPPRRTTACDGLAGFRAIPGRWSASPPIS